MRTSWVCTSGSRVWEWIPLPGIDPSLGEKAMWTASAAYAAAKENGLSETAAQQEAEKVAFQVQYTVSYTSTGHSQIIGKHKETK